MMSETLNDEELTQVFSRLFQRGETMISSIDKFLTSGVFESGIKHLEAGRLEADFLSGIARFDTQSFLVDFDNALAHRIARESFANKLLDCCLDGFLHAVPDIRLP